MLDKNIYINDYNVITPLGDDLISNWDALVANQTGITIHNDIGRIRAIPLAKIKWDISNKFEERVRDDSTSFTRLEKMLLLALLPIIPSGFEFDNRCLLVLATTKGNVTELGKEATAGNFSYLANRISKFVGCMTPALIISNACVSGVMAVSVAKNLILTHQYDHVFVIAGDEISEFVTSGFNSFQALSDAPCKPFDASRNGVTLGEAAAAIFISKDKFETNYPQFVIQGDSAVNDANHISGPSRTGEGLYRSIQKALIESNLQSEDIDLISAHGTATRYNDDMESIAFKRAGLQQTPTNSLKGYFGHTLGASGLLELVISIKSSIENLALKSKGLETLGVSENINVLAAHTPMKINTILKTASGFGGSNTAIIIKKLEA